MGPPAMALRRVHVDRDRPDSGPHRLDLVTPACDTRLTAGNVGLSLTRVGRVIGIVRPYDIAQATGRNERESGAGV